MKNIFCAVIFCDIKYPLKENYYSIFIYKWKSVLERHSAIDISNKGINKYLQSRQKMFCCASQTKTEVISCEVYLQVKITHTFNF